MTRERYQRGERITSRLESALPGSSRLISLVSIPEVLAPVVAPLSRSLSENRADNCRAVLLLFFFFPLELSLKSQLGPSPGSWARASRKDSLGLSGMNGEADEEVPTSGEGGARGVEGWEMESRMGLGGRAGWGARRREFLDTGWLLLPSSELCRKGARGVTPLPTESRYREGVACSRGERRHGDNRT